MKKNKFRWLSLLLVVMMLAAFTAGCGTTDEDTAQEPVEQSQSEVQTVSIEQVADNYFAEMKGDLYKISGPDLKKRIDANDDSMLIISIRSPEDYAKGHIKGAVNIPFKQVNEYLDKLPVDKELIVYCYSGQTAGQTVAIMNMYGYNAKSLNLGFDKGWVEKNNFPADTAPNELPENVAPAAPDPDIAQKLKAYYTNMPDHIYKIDVDEMAQKIEAGEDMQIVSIRSEKDYNKGHIPGAINIPFEEVNKHFDEFAADKPVYIYCYSGQTAGQTVGVLNVLGIDARSINRGFDFGWEPAGMQVEK